MNILSNAFTAINRKLYNILGPSVSTQLAHSLIGKTISLIAHGGSNTFKTYTAIDNIKMVLRRNEALTMGILNMGVLNPMETKFVKKILKPGDTFIDVGAYIDGWYTLLASNIVGKNGKVFSFEPHPYYAERLRKSIMLTKFKNITLENCGLSDKTRKAILYQGGLASSFIKHHTESLTKIKAKKIESRLITLDSYVKNKNIKNIKLIKIDVEGFEMKVISGSRNILKNSPPAYLLIETVDEFLKNADSSESNLISFMKNFGYKPYMFNNNGKVGKYLAGNLKRSINLIFCKKTNFNDIL